MPSLTQWGEITSMRSEARCELVLKSIDYEKRFPNIDDEELQETAFHEGSILNFVSITSCGMKLLRNPITRCFLLTRLVLVNNELTSIPDGIGSLDKLKFVDVSRNKLTTLPASFAGLKCLETFNAIDNQLTDDGLFDMSKLEVLHILDLSHNNLTTIPGSILKGNLVKLHTIDFSHNKIVEVDDRLDVITQLKDLKLAGNQIVDHPTTIARMQRIKVLDLSENPFKDNPFKKLTNDKRIKVPAVIAYIARVVPKKKDNKSELKTVSDTANDEVEAANDDGKPRIDVRIGAPDCSVKRLNSVKTVRPYLACCVLNNLDLAEPNFKKFINVQTKLHASAICANRTSAAIGTHEMKSFAMPLQYLALPADELHIRALHKKTPVSARELINAMVRDAELARKRVKRSTLNPMHRYLDLVQKLPLLPCLIDATGMVISLAPLTNSDLTKMTVNTKSVLVEVSSSESLEVCKEVMDSLIAESLDICPNMTVDQVRVHSDEDDLVSVYPDKNDLSMLSLKRVEFNSSDC